MTKYKVPEGMLKAAIGIVGCNDDEVLCEPILEAALRWLDHELEEMDKVEPFDRDLQIDRVRALWLEREPESPEEICKEVFAAFGDEFFASRGKPSKEAMDCLFKAMTVKSELHGSVDDESNKNS